MQRGYIKMWRKILDWEWYDHLPTRVLFLHLLLKVNHFPSDFKGQTINSGQVVVNIDNLSSQTGLTIKQVRTAIKNLKVTGELGTQRANVTSHKGANQPYVYTLLNYSTWQDDMTTKGKREGTRKSDERANEGHSLKNLEEIKNSIIGKSCPQPVDNSQANGPGVVKTPPVRQYKLVGGEIGENEKIRLISNHFAKLGRFGWTKDEEREAWDQLKK